MTSFILKCRRQAQGNNLCGYYGCENIHAMRGPWEAYADWELEVSKNLCQCLNSFWKELQLIFPLFHRSRRSEIHLHQRKGFWQFKKPCVDLLSNKSSTKTANTTMMECQTLITVANMMLLSKTFESLCIYVLRIWCEYICVYI